MSRSLFFILFAITFNEASSQRLEDYADKLYFGMLSFKPDTSITEFVTRYIPVVFKKIDTSGKWTVYPPDFIEPKFITVTNSYVFYKHPYFDANFNSGQLAITQKIYHDKKWSDNITEMKLWFEFENKDEAKKSFRQLVDTFSKFTELKRITSTNGVDKAELTDKNSDKYYSNVQIVLVKDYLIGKKFAMPTKKGLKIFTEAGYKILFQIGNDLY